MLTEIEQKSRFSCKRTIAENLIISPEHSFKISWDLWIGYTYFLSFIFDPYIFAFHFMPLLNDHVNNIQILITFSLVINIILKFFIAVKQED